MFSSNNNDVLEIRKDDITITSSGIFLNVNNNRIFMHRRLIESALAEVMSEAIESMKVLDNMAQK